MMIIASISKCFKLNLLIEQNQIIDLNFQIKLSELQRFQIFIFAKLNKSTKGNIEQQQQQVIF
ncbi:hypothetical protein pb186bvf_018043 [Paramecium bursaria]